MARPNDCARDARRGVLLILGALQRVTDPDEREEIARICAALTPHGDLSLTEMAEAALRETVL